MKRHVDRNNLMCRFAGRSLIRVAVGCSAIWSLVVFGSGGEPHTTASEHFDRVVAPILATRCIECHSATDPKGELDLSTREKAFSGGASGLAIVVGHPGKSLLWEKIDQEEMPPKHPLPSPEREVLKRWIQEGAEWGTETINPFRFSSAGRAGYDWWSFQPLKEGEPPKADREEWVRNGIDRFILAGLQAKNLSPSPEADARVLIRRVYFDLTGLPPSPEVVDVFVSNPNEEAYEGIVDQLLASPQYGERWAQHWLDVVRYGESGGFERNEPRNHSWRFRDWVIGAFNADMPYDEFVRDQLCGDLLQQGIEGASASGFLVAGVHNTVVGSSERMRKLARQDELEELAGTVGQTFLGLTVQCSRCHAHKFDPVSSKEYYQFIAALDGVNHGEREFLDSDVERRITYLRGKIDALEKERRELLAAQRAALTKLAGTTDPQTTEKLPQPLATWSFDQDFRAEIGSQLMDGSAVGGAKIADGALVVDGKGAYVRTGPGLVTLTEKSLEAWVILDNLDQRGGGVISVETEDGGQFDAIVYGEQEPKRWMAGSDSFSRTKPFGGYEEVEGGNRPVHLAITYSQEGVITAYRDGIPYGEQYTTGVQKFEAGKYRIVFGLRHSPPGGNRMFAGKILRASLYDRALSAEEVAASASHREPDFISDQTLVERMPEEERVRHELLRRRVDQLQSELKETEAKAKRKVYSVIPSNPGVMQVHERGDVTKLTEEVNPGGIAAVGGNFDFGISSTATDRDRRLKLADWMTDQNNSLFLRVIVNRLWHYHFGTGIVETPNDFGFNGGRPSHPELLDWLGVQLRENGMRLKPLHRLMVLSATYRQSSAVRKEGIEIDSGNRLLWRTTPRRLEGETLRDSTLFTAGILDLTPGGPGYQDVTVTPNNGTTYYEPIDSIHPEFRRRTIYRFVPRGGRSAILDSFDCPDPSVTAPRRQVTTTPLQALSLLNNQFILETSEKLAERVKRETRDNPDAETERMWKLTLGRLPDERERELSLALIHKHGPEALARALFNSNEFVVLE